MSAIDEFRELVKDSDPVSLTRLGALSLLNEINALQRQTAAKTIAERVFEATYAEGDLEQLLSDNGLEDVGHHHDYYDCSLELTGMPADFRLSAEQQEAISGAGFVKCYVNHIDKWETHYTWPRPFESVEGWRVSYPHKRPPEIRGDNKIWVEKITPTWPASWFEDGGSVAIKMPIGSEASANK